MKTPALCIQHTGSAAILFDREAPFSPLYPKEDVIPSPAQSQSPSSPGEFSSSTPYLRSQHRYSLTNGKGKREGSEHPWLTLLVSSRSPKPNFLPLFIGKDPISGTVELDLTKPETVREVKVTLKGETTHFTQESQTFLEISQILLKQSSGKLSGKHSYPFSFVLPNDVRVDELNWAMVYPPPPKFHERGILYIDYKIVVAVRHGLFSVDNSLMTHIVYMPETIAERPSALRERAYLEELPLALPALDSSGWKLFPSVKTDTVIPNVTTTLRLSIANPLSFALGTPIPLFLEIFNDGAVNFDTDTIDVRLVRTLTTRSATGGVHKLDIARAVFWSAPGSSPRRIQLCGEVISGRSITPGFVFSKCSVQYSIVLYPAHSPEQTKVDPLLEEEVLLALRNAPGVVPRSQAPPGVTPPQIEREPSTPSRHFRMDFGGIVPT